MGMRFDHVGYVYNRESKHPVIALKDVSFEVKKHEFIGLIGHTGSGKSTLIQHMNGLNLPMEGTVTVDGITTTDEKAQLRALRQKVGLVFQYPEDQLFEETVYQDIAFGPKNMGLDSDEIDERVRWAMACVGLDFEHFKGISPFDLSGGQQRRVAIAGVLALRPDYLVLDEPTAGLDPRGREEILGEIKRLYDENPEMTIILVTHSMEDIARFAARLIVIDHGEIVMDGESHAIFAKQEALEAIGLSVPQVTQFMRRLKAKGILIDDRAVTVDEAFAALKAYLNRGGATHE